MVKREIRKTKKRKVTETRTKLKREKNRNQVQISVNLSKRGARCLQRVGFEKEKNFEVGK